MGGRWRSWEPQKRGLTNKQRRDLLGFVVVLEPDGDTQDLTEF